ncbi:MAG: hypothetical protein AAF661_16425 [Pseudomonadota bacterium]
MTEVAEEAIETAESLAASGETMDLAEFLRRTGTSQTDFARQIQIDQSTVSRLVNRHKNDPVSFAMMIVIFQQTRGVVDPNSWFNLDKLRR